MITPGLVGLALLRVENGMVKCILFYQDRKYV